MTGFDEQQLATLRDMVRRAVTDEFNYQVQPLRDRQLQHDGRIKFLEEDHAVQKSIVSDLKEVVIGNEALGIRGIVRQIADLSGALGKLTEKIDAWTNQVRGAKIAFIALAAVSSVPALQFIGKLLGVMP